MKTKLTLNNLVQWMNENHSSLMDLQSRIQNTGMTVPISSCLQDIEYSECEEDLDSAATSLRVALKDGLHFAGPELKSEIQKHIKLI